MSHVALFDRADIHSLGRAKAGNSHMWLVASWKIEVLSSLRHYLLAQSHGYHSIIDRLEERGVAKERALDDLPRTNTIKVRTISKATLRKRNAHTCK